MKRYDVTITEADEDVWYDSATGERHTTAALAYRAACRRARRDATRDGEGNVLVITWEPTSAAGRTQVEALQ